VGTVGLRRIVEAPASDRDRAGVPRDESAAKTRASRPLPVNRALTSLAEARRELRKAADALGLAAETFGAGREGATEHDVSGDGIRELRRVQALLLDLQEQLWRTFER
jgi:hypothetical protein